MNQAYDPVAKTLHWLTALAVLLMLYGGIGLEDQTKEQVAESLKSHSGIGLVVLALIAAHFLWRVRHPAPPLPADLPRWQQIAARATHHALYLTVALQAIFGLMMALFSKFDLRPFDLFGLQITPVKLVNQIGHQAHGINAWIIIILVTVHTAAALYHHFVRKDNVLRRMLPFAKA